MRNRVIILLVVFFVLLLAPFAIRYLQFYELGSGEVAAPPDYDPARIAEVSQVATPPAGAYEDDPEVGQGYVLLDQGHSNFFSQDEIAFLDGRLAARGFEIITYNGSDLATLLRGVSAFVVITPLDEFDADEVRAVRDFVDRGGRLLLVGDPTRFEVLVEETDFSFTFSVEQDDIPLNSLANEFNISFNGDYLYNTTDNEGNFRNILLHGDQEAFATHDITDGLEQLAFYSAHSLQVGNEGTPLLRASSETWSSATDRPGGLVLGATSMDSRVLALGDIHFLINPYATVFDNGRFIAQIADFLTEMGNRDYLLADFPFFYQGPVDLVYLGDPDLGPEAFDEIISLQEAFRSVDRDLQLAAAPDDDHDVLYLGLYNEADAIVEILAAEGISLTINPPILTAEEEEALAEEAEEEEEPDDEEASDEESADEEEPAEEEADEAAEEEEEVTEATRLIESALGKVQMSGTSLLLLHEEGGQRQVVVLAASLDGLENNVQRLLDLMPLNADYSLADCLVHTNLALCPSDVSGEEVEAELLTGGEPDGLDIDDEEEDEDEGPAEEDEDDGFDIEPPEIDAEIQGSVGLDDTVSGSLEVNVSHGWTFDEGPATVDILMESEVLDGVLELYGPDGFIASADSGLSGDPELLEGYELDGDAEYTIVVRDYWGEEGDYTLTVTAVEAGEGGEEEEGEEEGEDEGANDGVFIFVDDDGTPLGDGITSATFFAEQLEGTSNVTVWTASVDGPLSQEILTGTGFLIWDSGDYRDEEAFLDEDSEVIFNYIDTSLASLLVVGSSPALFSYLETSSISDVEVSGDDPVLLEGFEPGAIIEFDQAYEAVIPDFFAGDESDTQTLFLLRGPNSADAGNVAAFANEDPSFDNQKTAFIFFPFSALPADVQDTLFANLIAWFDIAP